MFAFAPAIDQEWGRRSPRVASPVTSAGCLTRTARLFAREHRAIWLAITGQKCANIIRKTYKDSFAKGADGFPPASVRAGGTRRREAVRLADIRYAPGGRKRGRAA
jgi:hypothetical protein